MDLQEIIQGIRASRSLPSDDDLRHLPYKKAFVYGRVSSQVQVTESRESIRDIARQVMRAKKDGYNSGLTFEDVEKWLEAIQSGAEVNRILEDGDIIVDCQDLGLSGSLDENKRPGLAHLQRRVESGEVGAIYLTEGMSRLSRDRDRVLGYQLLKLLKQHVCRIRTTDGIYNPAIPRDWNHLADDVTKSAEEMKTSGIRMNNRRAEKAEDGEHVGSPVCPGYIVPIAGQKRDGAYVFARWQVYPPHQQVVIEALEEVVRQGSLSRAVEVLQARKLVFPFFPEDLKYMEKRSALRFYLKDSSGYIITYNALKSLCTNLRLTGIWQWRHVLIEHNHDPVVPAELFEQAYAVARATKPKGRAAYAEPMEWSGVLYCYNHDEPRRLSALNRVQRWSCRPSSQLGHSESCLQIADRFLTPPLTKEFLRCLDLTPHAGAVLEKLKTEVGQHSLAESQRRRQDAASKKRIAELEQYLGSGDPEREETYWRLIREEKAKLGLSRPKPANPKATPVDMEKVAQFLENLEAEWDRYPSRLRNRLIKLMVSRVELRHDGYNIEAIIVWKVGFRQAIHIKRPAVALQKEKKWQMEEDSLLKMLWPSSSLEAIMAALPGRTWGSLHNRASLLKLKRQRTYTRTENGRTWTNKDDRQLKRLYLSEMSINEVARSLNRSEGAVVRRACLLGAARPMALRRRKLSPRWEPVRMDVLQSLSSPSSS
jgi:DNA invertase Pin-like site-specific DNA recombinase